MWSSASVNIEKVRKNGIFLKIKYKMDSKNVQCNNSSDLLPDIEKIAKDVENELLPDKSRDRYEASYQKFIEWQKSVKTYLLTE